MDHFCSGEVKKIVRAFRYVDAMQDEHAYATASNILEESLKAVAICALGGRRISSCTYMYTYSMHPDELIGKFPEFMDLHADARKAMYEASSKARFRAYPEDAILGVLYDIDSFTQPGKIACGRAEWMFRLMDGDLRKDAGDDGKDTSGRTWMEDVAELFGSYEDARMN